MRHPYRVIMIMAVLCALVGCFSSKRPLLPESTAVAALGEGGQYISYACEHSVCETMEDTLELRLEGTRYSMREKDGKLSFFTLHPHGEGRFIVQMGPPEKGDPSYEYALLLIRNGELLVHGANCNLQNKAQLMALGVEISTLEHGNFIGSSSECKLDKVTDTKAFFAAVNWDEPMLKLVRQP